MRNETLFEASKYTKRYERRRLWRRIVTGMACMVACITAYMLILPAVTMEQKAYCDIEEHQHGIDCYEKKLVCGYEEAWAEEETESETIESEITESKTVVSAETHVHTDLCYEEVLICTKEEHTHELICFSDPNADVEDRSTWENSVSAVKLTGKWADDLASVAKSQLGYTESTKNYTVTEEGTIKGYTRYGAWYGASYEDWSAMFVSFCLNYAEIPESVVPYASSCEEWIKALSSSGDIYRSASGYVPSIGDIIFLDQEGDGSADHAGIVTEVSEDGSRLSAVIGDSEDCVQSVSCDSDSSRILGYAVIPENPEYEEETTEEEESVSETTENETVQTDAEEQSQEESQQAEQNREESKPAEESIKNAETTEKIDSESVQEEFDDQVYTLTKTRMSVQAQALSSSFEGLYPQYANYNDEMETISVTKKWTGDAEYNRPESITFDLYLDDQVLETLVLTASDGWEGSFEGSYPAYQLDEEGNYILDDNGEKIHLNYQVKERDVSNYTPSYSQNSQHSTVDTSQIHLFIPANSIVPGEQYLVVSGNAVGQQKVYRAEAYQTDGMLTSSIKIGGNSIKDKDGNSYQNYILLNDGDGSYNSLLWTAYDTESQNNSCYLFSNVHELWGECHGLIEMKSTQDKLKVPHVDQLGAGTDTDVDTQGFYHVDVDSIGNAYTTASGSDNIYLYQEVTPSDGAFNRWQTDVFVSNRYDPPITVDPNGETASEKTDMYVTKRWENDTEGDRPTEITVRLYANGEDTEKTITLSAENGWKGSFTGLDAYQDGKLISYSVKEEAPDGYSVQYDYSDTEKNSEGASAKGYWVRTNKLVDGETYLIVTSPSKGTVTGMEIEADGKGFAWTTQYGAGTINVEGTITINGQTYATHITQEEAAKHPQMQWIAHYDSASTSSEIGYHTWYALESVSNPGCYPKFNGEGNISTGIVHECLLYYGLQYTVDENGKYVAVDENGDKQDLTPTVENYPDDFNYVLGNHDHYFLLTNNHIGDAGSETAQTFYLYKFVQVTGPSVIITNTKSEETSLDVYKNWNDNNNKAGKRPGSITVQLLKNGTETNQTIVLSAENKWKNTFEHLPIYDENGKKIEYSVKEVDLPDGYTSSVMTGTVNGTKEITEYSWAWVPATTLEAGKTYILADGYSGKCNTIGVSDGKSTLSGTSVTIQTDAVLTGENGNHYTSYISDEDAAKVTQWNAQAYEGCIVLEYGEKYLDKSKGSLASSISGARLLQYDTDKCALYDSEGNYMATNGDFNVKKEKAVSTYLYERVRIVNTKTVDTVQNVATVTNTYQETQFILPETGGAGTNSYTMGGILLIVVGTFFLLYKYKKHSRKKGGSC